MDVRPANAADDSSLGDLFPHQPAGLESDESNTEWLSGYVEDCFSSSTSYTNPVSAMASEGVGKPKLPPPPSSNVRRKKRSLASVMTNGDYQQFVLPLYVEPPLILIDQKHWMAESELIHPKKDDDDREVCQQQGQEQEKGVRRLVKMCSNCLSSQTPRWRDGPSGRQMMCSACGMRLKPETRLSAEQQCGQEEPTRKEQEPDRKRKKAAKKTCYESSDAPPSSDQQEKRCAHCLSSKTPQWRAGPLGPKTLCNACGVRFKSGRLLPEYRPANSPTFVSCLHSNSHKKVMQMRQAVAQQQ